MLFVAEELRRSEQQVRNILNMDVEQRVAKAVLATLQCFGFDKDDKSLLAFTPSRQDLADYAGTTYESTIRAISELQKKKLIKTVGREIRVLDRKKLEKLLRIESIPAHDNFRNCRRSCIQDIYIRCFVPIIQLS
jgi:CRP-like cAMP-binding protein